MAKRERLKMGEQTKYTPYDMRSFADAIASDLNDNGNSSVTYTFNDLLPVIQSLRNSADSIERLEKVMEICKRVIGEKSGKYGIVSYMTLCGVAEEIMKAAVGNDGKQK